MKKRLIWALPLVLAATLIAAEGDYASAKKKFALIQSDTLQPGARVELTVPELNAYAEHELPAGVRNPKVQVTGPGIATGSAMVDFNKVQRSLGKEPNWLMGALLDGERQVSVTARITSSGGKATVDPQRVSISGMEIDGSTLDFLIDRILLPLYPEAVVGRPFKLGHNVERLEVKPGTVGVLIGR